MSTFTAPFSLSVDSHCLSFQGAQTVGMGAEAQSVPAAAKLFNQANDILGYRRTSPPNRVFAFLFVFILAALF
jgi:hypothetical protein